MNKTRMIFLCSISFVLSLSAATQEESVALQPDDLMLPQNHRIALYLDCGTGNQEIRDGALSLKQLTGEDRIFPNIKGALAAAAADPDQVIFEIEGFDPTKQYVLGFTWWDADNKDRVQSVYFTAPSSAAEECVLPPVRACSFDADRSSWARLLLPLTEPYVQDGSLRVAFKKESGADAVVNEIWLLESPAATAAKRVVIVTGDDYWGHLWRSTAPALAAALREVDGLEVSVTESPALLGSPLLFHYDAVVIHFKNYEDRLPLHRSCEKGLQAYADSGKGLTLTHFSCGAFENWKGFERIAGRVYSPDLPAHDPHGPFALRMTDTTHPVTAQMEAFEVNDELYTCLTGTTPITVLCESISVVDKKVYPMAFIVDHDQARIFHCLLGHDASIYENPGARRLYQRGIAWAAGLLSH